jgi:DNA-binding NtrC family response regulator
MRRRAILLVDDDECVRNALRRALVREEYTVHLAESAADGLEVLKHEEIDVAISDHLMPKMTGLEFLKIVRDRHPGVGRVMLTGHADMETAIRGINEGEINRFLLKPWDDTELKVTIHLVIEQVELAREHRLLLSMVRRQSDFLLSLQREHPEIFSVRRDDGGAIVLTDDELSVLNQ